jgi:hypothetical protein
LRASYGLFTLSFREIAPTCLRSLNITVSFNTSYVLRAHTRTQLREEPNDITFSTKTIDKRFADVLVYRLESNAIIMS